MHLVEITPAPCNICGVGNTPDSNGDRRQFVDFERDINWNDPLIICEDCIAKAGGLVGMASKDTMQELRTELRARDKKYHDLESEVDGMKRRAKRLGITFDRAVA